MFLTDAAIEDDDIIAFDVSKAFCESRLPMSEAFYIKVPDDYTCRKFDIPVNERKFMVFKVLVDLYGKDDAMHKWLKVLVTFLEMQCGFTQSAKDSMQFYRDDNGQRTQIGVHVDDGLMRGPRNIIESIMKKLSTRFNMKYEWEPTKFVGINIWRDRKSRQIAINQYDYIEDMITRYGSNTTLRKTKIPMNPAVDTTIPDNDLMTDIKPYQELVGSIMHATMTRKDILYAASIVGKYMSRPTQKHYALAQTILNYLAETKDYALILGKFSLHQFETYCDASFANEEERKSRTGAIILYRGSLVSAISKVQKLTTLSTAESEYVAMNEAAVMSMYLRQYVESIGRPASEPTRMYIDNTAAISMTEETANFNRTKHIAIRYHSTRQFIRDGHMQVEYVNTEEQIADVMTKALGPFKFDKFRAMMNYREGFTSLKRSVENGPPFKEQRFLPMSRS
jgi:hypothetical protein